MKKVKQTKRIFSGIQPTGNLHIGNFLGAIKNWKKLQNENFSIFSIVDMHALTIPNNNKKLKEAVYEVTAAIIASGINPKKSIIFNQSFVGEHAELAWIFNCISKLGWLNRMTQFKEKAGSKKENATVGLFSYPLLMAADILLYKSTHVPVGEDQKQHLELTRDIANAFNNQYRCSFFELPEPIITGPAKRIMSLKDGTKKMSKSDISDFSRINLIDEEDLIKKKIQKAKTDQFDIPDNELELKNRYEVKNLINIYAALSDSSLEKVLKEYSGKGFAYFKKNLVDIVVKNLSPISKEMNYLLKDKTEIEKILIAGGIQAKEIASPILNEVKELVGFIN